MFNISEINYNGKLINIITDNMGMIIDKKQIKNIIEASMNNLNNLDENFINSNNDEIYNYYNKR